MTQKDALTHALAFVDRPYHGNGAARKAARAFCVIEWLHDMNWHPEADAIEAKLDSMAVGKQSMRDADMDGARAKERDSIASFLNWLYGWGLETRDWRGTRGAPLVEELWGIIASLPD